jgi:hypothetical protein
MVLSSRSVHLDAKIHGAYFFRKLAVKPGVGSRRPQVNTLLRNFNRTYIPRSHILAKPVTGGCKWPGRGANTTQVYLL